MNIIFLDVDGVLNCQKTNNRVNGRGSIGIDKNMVKILREIIDKTNSQIILCSSWKTKWYRIYKDQQDIHANYLDRKLAEQGLYILDKTIDKGSNRGEGIYNCVKDFEINKWIVIDDEIFEDYEKYNIIPHLLKTSFYDDNGGLQKEHINKAIELFERMD